MSEDGAGRHAAFDRIVLGDSDGQEHGMLAERNADVDIALEFRLSETELVQRLTANIQEVAGSPQPVNRGEEPAHSRLCQRVVLTRPGIVMLRRNIFPVGPFGRASTNQICRGYLYAATRSLT